MPFESDPVNSPKLDLARSQAQSCKSSCVRQASPAPSTLTYPEGGPRAYLVVLGSFLGMSAGFGFMNTLGTLQAYIAAHQLAATSESAIGWIFSLYIFIAFFGGIQVGPAFDQWGPRGLVATGGVLLVAGVVGLANATAYWHFVLTLSIMCGLGTTFIFTPCISVIAHYFDRRRGVMTGLAATGGSVGGVLYPLVLPVLFDAVGFAWAMRAMALVFLVCTTASFALLRARLPPHRGGSVRPDLSIFRNVDFALTTAGVFAMEFGLFVPLTSSRRGPLTPASAAPTPASPSACSPSSTAPPSSAAGCPASPPTASPASTPSPPPWRSACCSSSPSGCPPPCWPRRPRRPAPL